MSAFDPQRANILLAALPALERQRLLARCKLVPLIFGDVLYEPRERIAQVYFPINSLISLLTLVEGHMALEVGMIGREGMLGVPLILNVKHSPVRALVQGPGDAWQMSNTAFLKEFERGQPLQRAVLGFTNSLMQQIAQVAACNRFHPVEARLARWLLMTRDRVGTLEFRLTHQFLASMLGVRREGVTQAASRLNELNLVEFGRGWLSILDEAGLEAKACACYALVRIPMVTRPGKRKRRGTT